MNKLYDVIIAGAGPVGLLLGCELALAHASVLILERDATAESSLKVEPLGLRGLNTLAVEALYRRGLLSELTKLNELKAVTFQNTTKATGAKFGGHFAGIMIDGNKLELDRWKYRLPGPALSPTPTTTARVETVVTARAERLGVTILRDHGVTSIAAEDSHSVTVEAGKGQTFRGKWLVGCDGGRSLVRKAVGIDFEGTEAKCTGYAVRCELDPPGTLPSGFHTTKAGMYIVRPPETLYLLDFDGAAFDRTQEITKEHIQSVLERVVGNSDTKVKTIHQATSFTDRSKQAARYRKGRVLLAGDAAHIASPLGAQGMNVGLGDAISLGWKLAATIRREEESGPGEFQESDLALLDTYEKERHPIAAWVLEWTRAQITTLQPDLYGAAVQSLIRDIIDTTDGANLFIGRVWGLSQRYRLGDDEAHAHELVGSSAPDFELLDGSRLGSKLEAGRGLLLDFGDDAVLKELVVGGKYQARVDYLNGGAKDKRGILALLIRPDGVVAWVTEEGVKPDVDAAKAALEMWFGF